MIRHALTCLAALVASHILPAELSAEPSSVRLGSVTIFVEDYDEAITWYVDKLGFEVRIDMSYGEDQRFVALGLPGQDQMQIALNIESDEYQNMVGQQSLWVFRTNNCEATSDLWRNRGVVFREPCAPRGWGAQAIFVDLYGNVFVLLEAAGAPNSETGSEQDAH